MAGKIKGVFDTLCQHLKIDTRLIQRLSALRIGFTTRNEDHISFFGGNLTGVHVVRFTPADRDTWFEDILQTNELVLEQALLRLDVIKREFKVTSDTMNNSCIWLIHRILNEPGLTPKQKHQGSMDVALILNYKFFTSRLSRHFRYPADPDVAAAVYASLSRKFDIKVAGNWNAYFNNRCEDILSERGIHHKTFVNMSDDIGGVRYAISDIQGRIREMLKLIANIHYQMNERGVKISSTSSVMEYDGEAVLKDRVKSISVYGRYLLSVLPEPRAFIKPVLVQIIATKLVPTMPPKQFDLVLESLSKHSVGRESSRVEKLVNDTLIHAFNYLYSNRQIIRNTNDLAFILTRLRGTYSSSRSTDQQLLKLRKDMEAFVQESTKTRHAGNISSVRTGVLLYIVARALTMRHYRQ